MAQSRGLDERRKSWEEHIRAWRSSGLSQAEYCRQHGISSKSFLYWKRKHRAGSEPACLVEVSVASVSSLRSRSNPVRLMVGDHYRIEIEKDFDPATLDQLLHFLERR